MKRCPDREKLYLFLDNELSVDEIAGLKKHIEKCSDCQKELRACESSEKLFRRQFNDAFSAARSNVIIMEKVRNFKSEVSEGGSQHTLSFPLIFKVLAMAVILLAVIYLISQKNTYHGTVMAVTCQALDSNSSADEVRVALNSEFALESSKKTRLSGNFLFKIPDSENSRFRMKGLAEVEVQESKPVFSEADIELLWVAGRKYEVMVNGKLLKVESENPLGSSSGNLTEEIIPSTTANTPGFSACASSSKSTSEFIRVESPEKLSSVKVSEEKNASETASSSSTIPSIKSNYHKNPFSEDPVIPLSGN